MTLDLTPTNTSQVALLACFTGVRILCINVLDQKTQCYFTYLMHGLLDRHEMAERLKLIESE
jgi:hypothetical protein